MASASFLSRKPPRHLEGVTTRRWAPRARFFSAGQKGFVMSTVVLEVQGMSCNSCVATVLRALKPFAGVDAVAVDLPSGRVRVSGDLDPSVAARQFGDALAAAGYPTRPAACTEPASSTAPATITAKRRGCC